MAEHRLEMDDPADDLPRGLFGYRTPTVNRYIRKLQLQDDMESRSNAQEVQRLTSEIIRLRERRRTLDELSEHVRLSCERLEMQIAQAHVNARWVEVGMHHEIEHLQHQHEERLAQLQHLMARVDVEAQSHENQLWQLAESLTRLLQESQDLANQQLSADTVDAVWQDFAQTVLNNREPSALSEMVMADVLERRIVDPDTVVVSSRKGNRIGTLEAVLLTHVPPSLAAYQIKGVGCIPATDAQVLRTGRITVSTQFTVLDVNDIVRMYASPSRAPDVSQDTGEGEARTRSSWSGQQAPLDTRREVSATEPVSARDAAQSVRREKAFDLQSEASQSEEGTSSDIAQDPSDLPVFGEDAQDETGTTPAKPTDRHSEIADRDDPSPTPALDMEPPSTEEAHGSSPSPNRDDAANPLWQQEAPHVTGVPVLPAPSWTAVEEHRASPRQHRALPGISEAHPPEAPAWGSEPLEPAVFDEDSLPGLHAKNGSTIPQPSWTDQAITNASNNPPPAKPRPRPEPPSEATPGPELNESGALDVRTFLHGRRVGQDITDAQGRIIARSGDVITAELVQQVEQAGFLPDLIVHMEF